MIEDDINKVNNYGELDKKQIEGVLKDLNPSNSSITPKQVKEIMASIFGKVKKTL
jgi:hypothetical protein